MDPQLYQQVLLAVQASHSPLASSGERQAAYVFCEDFKNRADCVSYAVALYRNPGGCDALELHTRQHFALHVLEHHVLNHWSFLSVENQHKLRIELISLLLHDTQSDSADEPVFIREKKVSLVAHIAKRQFPQHWPELIPDLLQVWSTGACRQVELVLLILRSLAEDCVSSSFNTLIPPARRKDILQGLNVCLPQLFPVVYQELEKRYSIYKSTMTTKVQKRWSERLLHAAMAMLKEFFEWVPLEQPLNPDTNFIMVAVLFLEDEEFQSDGAECLQAYMTRGFGKENRALMLQSIGLIIEKVENLNLTNLKPNLDKKLMFHKKVNDLLVTWGTCQLELMLDHSGESEMALLHIILRTMCKLFAHPSIVVTEAQIIFWLVVLKNKTVLKQGEAYLSEIVEQLRQVSFDKYFKLSSPERDEPGPYELACMCSREDFDDHVEYISYYGNFRGRLYALIRLLVQSNPTDVLQSLHERLIFVLSHYRFGTDHLSPDCEFCTDLSTTYLYHEGITSLIDCIVKQLPAKAMEHESTCRLLQGILQAVMAYDSPDPLLKFRQLLVLASFAKYYTLDSSSLTIVFEILFANIDFVMPGENVHGRMSTDTINVRRRALSSLVSICQTIPAHILPVLPVLCTKAHELFASDRVTDTEGVMLYEMLVLVSNSMESLDERVRFVEQIVQEPITHWTNPDTTALVSSPQNIMNAIEAAATDEKVKKGLCVILKSLTTLYGIAKRAGATALGSSIYNTSAFDGAWPHLLPNLVALIRSLHGLQASTIKDVVLQSSTACWLLSISIDEVAQLLGGKNQLEEEKVSKLPAASKWSKWHKNVRDISYHLMGVAVSQKCFYENPQVAAVLQNSMLSDLNLMEHRHLKCALAYVYLPFLKKCPKELYSSLLDPVLTMLFGHFAQRARIIFYGPNTGEKLDSTLWNGLVVGIEDAKQEIAREKMVLELTRQIMEFIENAVDPRTVVDTDTGNPKHVTNPDDAFLREYILFQSAILPFTIIAVLIQIICWKDTLSCRKAVLLSEKLVNVLYADVRFHEVFGRDLFSAALQGLLHEYVGHVKDDGLKWEIINLARNIYCRLTLGLIPVEECKGIDPCNQPLRPDSSLCAIPRDILLSLPDVTREQVDHLDSLLREKHSMKTQKNAFKELLEMPILAIREQRASMMSPLTSLLSNKTAMGRKIIDLSEKLILSDKEAVKHNKWQQEQTSDLNIQSLFQQR
ncbi:armadillo-like helical domain-containing protein [Plasmopara halstedii]|uniref:Armadillo-like helical domain-containing protein n=1 Tax=Plasmopara halstedii TaxID=4781 RepID=A0A0P1A9B3_PLAHL|nr:armadillo-like helical domain-containing protein [Plasmopara halstedii]CEG37302.1 armadillo-like helical domain-containing protein [Plasmopara halstedii]|eukprot:XP_024573671.1 armadillo-like helical domain-containing protein [Plasmopara halstedii]